VSSLPTLVISFQCHPEVFSDFIQRLCYLNEVESKYLLFSYPFSIPFTSFFVLTTISRWWYISQKRGIHKNLCFNLCSTSILHSIFDLSFSLSLDSIFDHLLFNLTFNLSLELFPTSVLDSFDFISTYFSLQFLLPIPICLHSQLDSSFNHFPLQPTFISNNIRSEFFKYFWTFIFSITRSKPSRFCFK
jgi:hypothetical protein